MRYIIINTETNEYAHVQIKKFMSNEDSKKIPYEFNSYEAAMEILNCITYPEWTQFAIVEV